MSKKILIIDDEPDIMKILVYRLQAKNYQILTAGNGESGIKIAEANTPDLILLDYKLPDMKASDISKEIKMVETLKNIPIILITASIDDIETKSKECKAEDYIAKPIDPDTLYKKVEEYINKNNL